MGLETFGINTATNAVNGLVGMAIGQYAQDRNDRRQLDMQSKLQAMQEAGNKRMAAYTQNLGKEMWDYTNYENQMKHMKAAGLNPALMYGQGGGGGSTANGGSASGVSGGSAPVGGGEIGMGLQSAMQMQLLQSQKAVLDSQANKNNVEAAKTAGVDTEQTKATTENLWQGLTNARNEEGIQRLKMRMMNIENFEKQSSQGDRLDYITLQTMKATQELRSAAAQANLDQGTVDNKIKIIQQEAIGAVIKNELQQQQINVNNAQMQKWAAEVAQGWQGLSQNDRRIKLQAWEDEIKAQFPGISQTAGKLFNNVLEGIDEIFNASKGTHRTYDVPKDIKH